MLEPSLHKLNICCTYMYTHERGEIRQLKKGTFRPHDLASAFNLEVREPGTSLSKNFNLTSQLNTL